MVQRIRISTVTPVYAGEAYLENLIRELVRIREEWKNSNMLLELNVRFVCTGRVLECGILVFVLSVPGRLE
jgi:hypothetical protein